MFTPRTNSGSVELSKSGGVRKITFIAAGGVSFLAALALSACGGGGGEGTTASADLTTSLASLSLVATPMFHTAPVDISDPSLVPSDPTVIRTEAVLPGMESLDTAKLLPETVIVHAAAARRFIADAAPSQGAAQAAAAATTAPVVTVFTPAQIRAAYKLPAVAATGVVSTAAARAALGAGQTIYLIDAYHNPNTFSDLNAYSTALNLPACTSLAISATAVLPLAPASATAGCAFGVVYAGATTGRTATAPAYNAGWATEIALDVESAHAIAPLARIILIEAASASLSALGNAITIANTMGPGVVSMSFGAPEGGWVSSIDTLFQGKGMQYTASTGDSGAAVNWPAVSAHVVATGGTSLVFNGVAARTETVWSGTGGGTSAYVPVPSYQSPLSKTVTMRRVADVAFDSDPYTGQYMALTIPGKALAYYSVGGTSIAAPEWAGLLAVASAQRALVSLPALTSVHNALYLNVLSTAATYLQSFLDVAKGSDGTCATCTATTGYDTSTGLGSPNATDLLSVLSTVKQ